MNRRILQTILLWIKAAISLAASATLDRWTALVFAAWSCIGNVAAFGFDSPVEHYALLGGSAVCAFRAACLLKRGATTAIDGQ